MKRDGHKLPPEDKNEPDNEEVVEEKTDEYKDKYLRALADYQNLEKQTREWKESFAQFAASDLIRKLLEVLDDLEKAQEHINDEGLALIITKVKGILREEGLEELEIEGHPFDPNLAEVTSTEPAEKPNIIVKVLQKGYKLKDRVVRPAKVTVSVTK